MSAKLNSGIAMIGIDIGKNSFHVVGHDKRGAIMLRQISVPSMSANGMVRPCSGPASKRTWQGAAKTRSTPCQPNSILQSP
jgi:hypothetical protein